MNDILPEQKLFETLRLKLLQIENEAVDNSKSMVQCETVTWGAKECNICDETIIEYVFQCADLQWDTMSSHQFRCHKISISNTLQQFIQTYDETK